MRRVAVLFAILLIAACPPRRGRARSAEPDPQTPTTSALSRAAEEAAKTEGLAEHLKSWETITAGRLSVRAEITLERTDHVTKKVMNFSGSVLLMKPHFAVFRLNNASDPTKTDYEAYIRNENSVHVYNGAAKTVTEFKRPFQWPWPFQRTAEQAAEELEFGFSLLTGVKASELQERFEVSLLKTDENYIYFDLKPRSDRERIAFQHLRLALYSPGPNTAKVAYLPAQIYVLKPNGDTEMWKFTNPMVNVPGLEAKHFQRVEIKESGWTYQNFNGSTSEPEPPKP